MSHGTLERNRFSYVLMSDIDYVQHFQTYLRQEVTTLKTTLVVVVEMCLVMSHTVYMKIIRFLAYRPANLYPFNFQWTFTKYVYRD